MAIFSYEMKVGIGDINLTENNSLVCSYRVVKLHRGIPEGEEYTNS